MTAEAPSDPRERREAKAETTGECWNSHRLDFGTESGSLVDGATLRQQFLKHIERFRMQRMRL
jgi:hypothetical protein